MNALRYAEGRLELVDIPEPDRHGEATVRVSLSGICGTDLEIARGYGGFEGTLGHEFVGVVVNAPGGALVGQRVVGEINAGCGNCQLCVSGDSRHCAGRTVLGISGRDGAHAEYLQLPLVNLLAVPSEVSDERAVFAEPLAAACAILDRASVIGRRVAVIGDGKLGLLCARVLALSGAQPLVIGKHSEKLSIAESWGIDTITVEALDNKGARTFEVVVEASGSSSGLGLAFDLLRPRGVIVLKSTFYGATELNTSRIVVDEIKIIGSRCGRLRTALQVLKEGSVDVERLITDQYPLRNGLLAMQRATESGVLKVLLRP